MTSPYPESELNTPHCCKHHGSSSVTQSMDEMDFERGLWSAALNGEMDRIVKLIIDGRDVNGIDSSGYTPLHYSARNGHTEICSALLSNGARVNAQTRSGHVTPLHRAAYCGHVNAINTLLRHNADVTLEDNDGQNALHKACEKGHVQIVRLLMNKDKRLSTVQDNRGRLPRDLTSNDDVIELLSNVT